MQSKEIIEFLKRPDARELISEHRMSHVQDIVLRLNSLKSEDRKVLAGLLKIYRKADEKLPEFLKSYPALTEKTYEQSSSEVLAEFKADMMQGKLLVNLSGGLGIDDFAFSRRFKNVLSLDVDIEIHEMAVFNLERAGIQNIRRICSAAESYEIPVADVIYVDPDRRVNHRRNFHLEDASPNVISGHLDWLKKAPVVFIKLSPMADITEICRVFKKVKEIHIVSWHNEVKEILVKLEANSLMKNENPPVYAHLITSEGRFSFQSGILPVVKNSIKIADGNVIFVEAAAALIKAGIDKEYFEGVGLKRCGPNSAFYEGDIMGFPIPGRAFQIIYKEEFSGKSFSDYLKSKGITQAHVKKRDFPLESEEIKKKYKLKDGGEDYLFFYTNEFKIKMFVHCRKPAVKCSLF